MRFKQMLQYRAAAIAGLSTQFFFGIIIVMAFRAFYKAAGADVPMSLAETTSYVWLGQALFRLLPWIWDREAYSLIRSGNVAYEIVRPVDLYWYWFSRSLALRAAPLVLQCAPVLLFAALFFGFKGPASPASALAFFVAICMALLLSAAITTLTNVTLMWTISGEGIARLQMATVGLMSGILIPLPFFPEWMQPVVKALPYRGLFDVPFRLYLGHIAASEAAVQIAGQVAWIIVIVVAGRVLLGRSYRRLVVQGG